MRYVTDLIKRYSEAGFITGTLVGEGETLATAAVMKAAIGLNELKYKQSKPTKAYDLQLFAPTDNTWAEMTLKYEAMKLEFGFGNATELFAPPPLMRFRRNKNITITVIDEGEEAEVVENFGINSWDIEWNGLIVDMEEHAYPGNKVKQLKQLFDINDVIEVTCPLLLDLGIKSVYLKDQEIEPMEGYPDTVKYSITAKSAKPAVFTLIQQ